MFNKFLKIIFLKEKKYFLFVFLAVFLSLFSYILWNNVILWVKDYLKELSAYNTLNIPDSPHTQYASISNFASSYKISNGPLTITNLALSNMIKKHSPTQKDLNDGIVPTYSMIHGKHLAELNANHIESACIFTGQITNACKELKNILLNYLK